MIAAMRRFWAWLRGPDNSPCAVAMRNQDRMTAAVDAIFGKGEWARKTPTDRADHAVRLIRECE